MGTTASGFWFPDVGYTSGWRQAIEDAADANENIIAGTRAARTFAVADNAELAALASTYTLSEGLDFARRDDDKITYRYSGSAWQPWDGPAAFTRGAKFASHTGSAFRMGRIVTYTVNVITNASTSGADTFLTFDSSFCPEAAARGQIRNDNTGAQGFVYITTAGVMTSDLTAASTGVTFSISGSFVVPA